MPKRRRASGDSLDGDSMSSSAESLDTQPFQPAAAADATAALAEEANTLDRPLSVQLSPQQQQQQQQTLAATGQSVAAPLATTTTTAAPAAAALSSDNDMCDSVSVPSAVAAGGGDIEAVGNTVSTATADQQTAVATAQLLTSPSASPSPAASLSLSATAAAAAAAALTDTTCVSSSVTSSSAASAVAATTDAAVATAAAATAAVPSVSSSTLSQCSASHTTATATMSALAAHTVTDSVPTAAAAAAPATAVMGAGGAAVLGGAASGTPASSSVRKRRRNGASTQEQLKQLLEALLNHKRPDGSYLTELYYRLPKRRDNEQFYQVIARPIDLAKIQVNLSNHLYDDAAHLSSDVELLVNNTKQYFPPGSMEHEDAIAIWEVFCEYRRSLMPSEDFTPATTASSASTATAFSATASSATASSAAALAPTLSSAPSAVAGALSCDRADQLPATQLAPGAATAETAADSAGASQPGAKTPGRVGRPPRRVSETVSYVDDESETNSSIAAPSETNSWTPGELDDALEELFSSLATVCDSDGRKLCTWFQLVPLRKKMPQYYEVIRQPIDMKTIAQRVQQQEYQSLHELEHDVALMCRNACQYNEPASQIYRDARALRKLCQSRRAEIEHSRLSAAKCSERIRSRRMAGMVCCSGEFSQLQYDSDEVQSTSSSSSSSCGAGGGGGGGADNPIWQLFDCVRSYTTPAGCVLSEPFSVLPSRRLFPDYYQQIKQPIALRDIKRKIKTGCYADIHALECDLSVMLANAQQYNGAESRLYKNAVRLQRVMHNKLAELNCESDAADDTVESDVEMSDAAVADMIATATARHTAPLSDSFSHSDCGGGGGGTVSTAAAAAATATTASSAPVASTSTASDAATGTAFDTDNNAAVAAGDIQSLVLERCRHLLATVRDYVHEDGRQLSSVFAQLPSRKQYPDYYDIIDSPVDLALIQCRIDSHQYETESEILQDFKLMFNNCRQYNEEGSVIYDDASQLERVLMSRVKQLGPLPEPPGADQTRPRLLNRAQLLDRMRDLYAIIRDYRDSSGHQLSAIFMKLPSKTEYPEYYEVIKRPMHMERIHQKLKTGVYATMDDIMADFVLMFENACKFNEPDSMIYKDALSLHRLALQTKLQMTEDLDEVPDVKVLVQELLTSLFIATYNHQDATGRCYSDSLAELPEFDEPTEGQPRVRAACLEMVKRGLDRGHYCRLDAFQRDLLAVFERARRLARPDSHLFDDILEMQTFYLDYRDELCRSGTLLSSPALQLTQSQFERELTLLKAAVKLEEEDSRDSSVKTVGGDAISFNQVNYTSGEFVYVENRESRCVSIVLIERLWINTEGQQVMYGSVFIKPEETVHLVTRKFFPREVFKSDQHVSSPMSKVIGKCCVLTVQDYFTMKPLGYDDKDIYVCESRYSTKTRTFKKIKVFTFAAPVNMTRREVPLEPRRVATPFRRLKESSELDDVELFKRTTLLDVVLKRDALPSLPSAAAAAAAATGGDLTYYEQLVVSQQLVVKLADCVYVKLPESTSDKQQQQQQQPAILQVTAMWSAADGVRYVHGALFVRSDEIAVSEQQLFYRHEVLATRLPHTCPLTAVTGRCCVLNYTDYCSRRPTEVAEQDVFVCENSYEPSQQEQQQQLQQQQQLSASIVDGSGAGSGGSSGGGENLVSSLSARGRQLSGTVQADEVYHFRRLLVLRRQPLADIRRCEAMRRRVKSMLLASADDSASSPSALSKLGEDDSLDGIHTASSGAIHDTSVVSGTPTFGLKKARRVKVLTGYILFSADVRKRITNDNPDANFGDISRLVGVEWKRLSQSMRAVYEERAQRANAEALAARREDAYDQATPLAAPPQSAAATATPSPAVAAPLLHASAPSPIPARSAVSLVGVDVVYECCWQRCDWQFEDLTDLLDHCQTEHVPGSVTPADDVQCQWRGCSRARKSASGAFPTAARLVRHLREVHILRNNGRRLASGDQRARNFVARRSGAVGGVLSPAAAASSPAAGGRSSTPTPAGNGAATAAADGGGGGGGGVIGGGGGDCTVAARFVSVPAQPQRLLHSEVYLRYIESMNSGSAAAAGGGGGSGGGGGCGWQEQLHTCHSSPPAAAAGHQVDTTGARLPLHWLAPSVVAAAAGGATQPAAAVKALWHLRDYMLKDALGIARAYNTQV